MNWRRGLLIVGLVSAATVGIVAAGWRAAESTARPATSSPRTVVAQPAQPRSMPRPASAAVPEPPQPAATALPPGVSAEQWAALRAEYADRPDELRRLAAHFTFTDTLDRFRAGGTSDRSAGQIALAQSLDAGLDERLRERELSAAEARLIKIAVLEALLGDDQQRAEALERWEASLAPPAPDPARSAIESDFQRRQAAIVAAWRALPAERRDPRTLERELQALRVSSFDNPQPEKEGVQR